MKNTILQRVVKLILIFYFEYKKIFYRIKDKKNMKLNLNIKNTLKEVLNWKLKYHLQYIL